MSSFCKLYQSNCFTILLFTTKICKILFISWGKVLRKFHMTRLFHFPLSFLSQCFRSVFGWCRMVDVRTGVQLVAVLMVTPSHTAGKHSIISHHFLDGQMEDLAALNNRVNIKDFQIPEGFDLESVVSAITTVSSISHLISAMICPTSLSLSVCQSQSERI